MGVGISQDGNLALVRKQMEQLEPELLAELPGVEAASTGTSASAR
jgi:hypothetical protein